MRSILTLLRPNHEPFPHRQLHVERGAPLAPHRDFRYDLGVKSPTLAPLAALSFAMLTSCVEAPTSNEEDATASKPNAAEVAGCQTGAIKKSASGEQVVVCSEPFADGAAIRPPADDLASTTAKFYGGATVPTTPDGSFVLWDRNGARYVPVDSKGKPIAFTASASLPKTLHAPTNRITFTVYQFAGKLGAAIDSPYGSATAIQLSAARPVYSVPGCAVDGRLLGTWEGTASQRLTTAGSSPWQPAFDAKKRVPIHVTFDHADKSNPLVDYDGKKKLTDEDTFQLSGHIDNFDKDFTVGAKKYPSLKALGTKSPFYGATTSTVQLYRLGNMHGTPNDGHWVLTYPSGSSNLTGNGMSFTLTALTAPSMLFDADAAAKSPDLENLAVLPHIPYTSNGHTVELHQVESTGTDLCD